jgi:hypothetical protein
MIRARISITSAVIGGFIRAQLFHLERLFGIVGWRWRTRWIEIESELIPRSREAVGRLPVHPQSTRGDVLLAAVVADVRSLVVVQPIVQLQVDELRDRDSEQVLNYIIISNDLL